MSELASALFSIADAGEFGSARFYIVCEEVPLGTPESPLIVCGLSDTLRECPNVAKTRNGMPATAWKKYTNFASKNLPPSVYSGTFVLWYSCNITYQSKVRYAYCDSSFIKSVKRCAKRCPKVHSLSLLCGHTRIECQSVVRDTNPDVPVGMEETALFCSNGS